jgi:HlyD family secretion protein
VAFAPDPQVLRTLKLHRPGKGRRRLTLLVLAAVVLVGIVLAVTFAKTRASAGLPQYRTEKVERRDVRVTVSATGKLQAQSTVEIGAEVTGRVTRVLVDYNDRVTKGQLLAEIDPEQLVAAMDEAQAQLVSSASNIRTAEATVLETKQAYARAEEQSKMGLVAEKDREASAAAAARAEASLASARASAELSRATLQSARSRLGKTKIYAPIDGMVLSRSVEPGQTVTAGFQTPILFKVAEDLTKLSLYVDVDEADVGRVKEGMGASFTVDAYPERVFASRVLSFRNEPKTSQNVVTYEAVLSVDNGDRALRPGMTATATITSDLIKNALAVPNAALRFTPPVKKGFGPPMGQIRSEEKRIHVLRGGVLTPVVVKPGASDGHVTVLLDPAIGTGEEVVVDVLSSP